MINGEKGPSAINKHALYSFMTDVINVRHLFFVVTKGSGALIKGMLKP